MDNLNARTSKEIKKLVSAYLLDKDITSFDDDFLEGSLLFLSDLFNQTVDYNPNNTVLIDSITTDYAVVLKIQRERNV